MLSPNAVGSIDAIEYLSGASTEVRSEGSGPPLILLHGLQSDLTIWDGVCEHLRSVERIRLNFPGKSCTQCVIDYLMATTRLILK